MTKPSPQIDPLFVIFEQHLYNFQDSEGDRKEFVSKVINDYLSWLRRRKIVVPQSLEPVIAEELGLQVETMLVKKTYGCLSIEEYQKKTPATTRRRAKTRYAKLSKLPKAS